MQGSNSRRCHALGSLKQIRIEAIPWKDALLLLSQYFLYSKGLENWNEDNIC